MVPAASGRVTQDTTQLLEVLDRVLDRGIVIDAEMRLNVAGLAIAGIEARIVVATIETYLEYADAIGNIAPASWRGEPYMEEEPLLPSEFEVDPGHRIRPFLRDLDDLH